MSLITYGKKNTNKLHDTLATNCSADLQTCLQILLGRYKAGELMAIADQTRHSHPKEWSCGGCLYNLYYSHADKETGRLYKIKFDETGMTETAEDQGGQTYQLIIKADRKERVKSFEFTAGSEYLKLTVDKDVQRVTYMDAQGRDRPDLGVHFHNLACGYSGRSNLIPFTYQSQLPPTSTPTRTSLVAYGTKNKNPLCEELATNCSADLQTCLHILTDQYTVGELMTLAKNNLDLQGGVFNLSYMHADKKWLYKTSFGGGRMIENADNQRGQTYKLEVKGDTKLQFELFEFTARPEHLKLTMGENGQQEVTYTDDQGRDRPDLAAHFRDLAWGSAGTVQSTQETVVSFLPVL